MLKSFEYIQKMEKALNQLQMKQIIERFHIKLGINQQLDIHVSSDRITSIEELKTALIDSNVDINFKVENNSVFFNFYNLEEAEDEFQFFEGKNINYGLRRSLDNLIDKPKETGTKNSNVITFYSYKGGVGRTTSLALLARYYSETGKKVFIIDCDFEAPGLLNFFSVKQFSNPKNGVVEYINDKKFDNSIELDEDYYYQIANQYSGEGTIYMMPAGNIFSYEKNSYLEGLSRLDTFGPSVFHQDMEFLINDIQQKLNPDVILIDSRTGFNNVFGALTKLSNHIVALFGDDIQNQPGIEFLLDKYSEENLLTKITIVLSIVSTSVRKRFLNLTNRISKYISENAIDNEIEYIIPTFFFPREPGLELIGTDDEIDEDFIYFSSCNTPTSYSPFQSHMKDVLDRLMSDKNLSDLDDLFEEEDIDELEENLDYKNSFDDIKDNIINDLFNNFPDLYAENATFDYEYLQDKFYLRKCMQDIFLPEYKFLIGGKGTGKTYFYKALQNKNFVNGLLQRAEKNPKKNLIKHIVSEVYDNTGFFDFTTHFEINEISNEVLVRKFWIIYIWSILSTMPEFNHLSSCDFTIVNNHLTYTKIKKIIDNNDLYYKVESDLSSFDQYLKSLDQNLIITFDQLDSVVKPLHWDFGISPLIKICQSNSWDRIQPKLFLRKDLFEKIGNLTNKRSLDSLAINLEWSQEEMYAYFFKVVYANSKVSFENFLNYNFEQDFVKNRFTKRLAKKNSFNQLPDDEYILRPLVNKFFGQPRLDSVDAYEALYRNIRNANQTISLRPFLDMIKLAIIEQKQDNSQKRGTSVLGIDYCLLRSVRQKAVERYFKDMANEAGNEVIRYFIEDIQNNKVPDNLKCSSLLQKDFEKLVEIVKVNHPELTSETTTAFEEMLVLNGIIFVTLIPGGIKKYSFAYLYKFYLNLKSPREKSKNNRNKNY
ncbi:tyrosine-protein kinase family protein [Acinetobacter baumannii]